MEYRTIKLKKGKERSMERKHPWIFSGALNLFEDKPKEGEIVRVEDARGSFIANGHYHDASIAVRVLTFKDESIDTLDFWKSRIKKAWDLRIKLGLLNDQNNIFRLFHAEGDGCPGLVIDYYAKHVIIQCHSVGMYLQQDLIAKAISEVLGKEVITIYSKSKETLHHFDGENGFLFGEETEKCIALENGIQYEIDWVNGQKTGFFIDQRENRSLLGKYSEGKKVLNTFCYSGGFSLAALKNNATLVHSLDSSQKAMDLVENNLKVNGFSKNHASITADAMKFMKELPEAYDVIVLDPPAFAKRKNARHKAIQGYKRLNALAIQQIKPGGIIFTFSCSQIVDKALFNNTIAAAAIEAGRSVQILEQLHQPSDHPINICHPEGEYLKGLVIKVD